MIKKIVGIRNRPMRLEIVTVKINNSRTLQATIELLLLEVKPPMVARLALAVSIAILQVCDFYSLATTPAVMTCNQYKCLASSKASSALGPSASVIISLNM